MAAHHLAKTALVEHPLTDPIYTTQSQSCVPLAREDDAEDEDQSVTDDDEADVEYNGESLGSDDDAE